MNLLQTLGRAQIDRCVELSKAGNPEGVKEIINLETERIRRELTQEILKKVRISARMFDFSVTRVMVLYLRITFQELKLKSDFDKELRTQMRRQAEVHADHIDEIYELQQNEMERELQRSINETVESLNIEYNRKLAGVFGRIKGIDEAVKGARSSYFPSSMVDFEEY